MNRLLKFLFVIVVLVIAALAVTPAFAQDTVTVQSDAITTPWVLVGLVALAVLVVVIAGVIVLLRIATAAKIDGAEKYQQGLQDGLKMLRLDQVPGLIETFSKHAATTTNPYDDFLAAAAKYGLKIILPEAPTDAQSKTLPPGWSQYPADSEDH